MRPPKGLSMLGAKRGLFLCAGQQDRGICPEDEVAYQTLAENQHE